MSMPLPDAVQDSHRGGPGHDVTHQTHLALRSNNLGHQLRSAVTGKQVRLAIRFVILIKSRLRTPPCMAVFPLLHCASFPSTEWHAFVITLVSFGLLWSLSSYQGGRVACHGSIGHGTVRPKKEIEQRTGSNRCPHFSCKQFSALPAHLKPQNPAAVQDQHGGVQVFSCAPGTKALAPRIAPHDQEWVSIQARICIAMSLTHNHTHRDIWCADDQATTSFSLRPRRRSHVFVLDGPRSAGRHAPIRVQIPETRPLPRRGSHNWRRCIQLTAHSSQHASRRSALRDEVSRHAANAGRLPWYKKAQWLLPFLRHNHNGSCPLLYQHQRAIAALKTLLPSRRSIASRRAQEPIWAFAVLAGALVTYRT